MKTLLKMTTNWRIPVLFATFTIATVLILGETESLTALLILKASGFGLLFIGMKLSKYWNSKNKIDELKEYINYN